MPGTVATRSRNRARASSSSCVGSISRDSGPSLVAFVEIVTNPHNVIHGHVAPPRRATSRAAFKQGRGSSSPKPLGACSQPVETRARPYEALAVIIPLIDRLATYRLTIYKHIASRWICRCRGCFVNVMPALVRVSGRNQKTSGLPCSRGIFGAERGGREARRWRRRAAKSSGVAVKNKLFAPFRRSSYRPAVATRLEDGSIVARGARRNKTVLRGEERSDERKVCGRAAIGGRRLRWAGVGAWRRQHRSRPMHHEDWPGYDDLHRLSTAEVARAVLRRHSRRWFHHHRARRPTGRIARHGAGNPHSAQCRPKGR